MNLLAIAGLMFIVFLLASYGDGLGSCKYKLTSFQAETLTRFFTIFSTGTQNIMFTFLTWSLDFLPVFQTSAIKTRRCFP
ncbi:hypothetical protein V5799_031961 [Amblyomma americanum]|uniref:Secreted protein n=1 Tax=Amblyomma americanum TaxID=6943 RepID=A0AAQ4DSI8_AMBAM